MIKNNWKLTIKCLKKKINYELKILIMKILKYIQDLTVVYIKKHA